MPDDIKVPHEPPVNMNDLQVNFDMENSQINQVAAFFVSYFHDEPIDDEAMLSILRNNKDQPQQRQELYQAFEYFLKRELPENALRDFIRSYANRHAKDDVQAREFIDRVRKETLLDYDPLDID